MFEREIKFEKKEISQPHYDAPRNFRYALDLLDKIEVLEPTLYWEFYDYKCEGNDKEGEPIKVITEPKYIFFCWEEAGRKWTGERDFHLNHEEFKKQFVDAVNFLLQRRFVKRKRIPIRTYRKPESPQRMKDSFQSLFGGQS
jgi:hypothetical protein